MLPGVTEWLLGVLCTPFNEPGLLHLKRLRQQAYSASERIRGRISKTRLGRYVTSPGILSVAMEKGIMMIEFLFPQQRRPSIEMAFLFLGSQQKG